MPNKAKTKKPAAKKPAAKKVTPPPVIEKMTPEANDKLVIDPSLTPVSIENETDGDVELANKELSNMVDRLHSRSEDLATDKGVLYETLSDLVTKLKVNGAARINNKVAGAILNAEKVLAKLNPKAGK